MQTKQRYSLLIFLSVTFLLTFAQTSLAANVTWTGGGGDGLWSTAANWDTATVPGSSDAVTIPVSAGTTTVTLAQSTTVQSIDIGSGSTLIIDAAGTGFVVNVSSGVGNSGMLELTNSVVGSASLFLSVNGGYGGFGNTAGGVVKAMPGVGGGNREIDACLNNSGTIEASTTFNISCSSGNHQNYANINVNSGGNLSMWGAGMGERGTITLASGGTYDLTNISSLTIQGSINGYGTLKLPYNTLFYGYLQPGTTSQNGTLSLGGNLTYAFNQSGTNVELDISGTGAGQYDSIVVTAPAVIDGILRVNLNGFTPSINDAFDIVTCSTSCYGVFTQKVLPALPVGSWWKQVNGGTKLTLSVAADSISPTDGAITSVTPYNTSVDLVWSAATDTGSGIATYKVAASTTSTPPDCSTGVSYGPSTSTTLTNLTPSTTYYVRICAVDNAGNISPGITTTAMTLTNTPPSAPQLVSPANGATQVNAWNLPLSWSASTDPDLRDSVSYDLYLDQSNPPVTVKDSNLSGTSYTTTLQKNATYYWQVVARDTVGALASSPTWSFTTANQPPLVSAQTYTTHTDTCVPSNYYYDLFNASDPDGTIVKYEWDLNSDGTYDMTTTTHSLIFNKPGVYSITLRVTDNDGATAVASRDPAYPVIVSSLLQADFVMNHILGQAPLTVNFTDHTNTNASCAGITDYAWDFGDGTSVVHSPSPLNPIHIFSTAGSFTVTMTVTETTGNQVTKTSASAVDVYNAPATPNLYVNGAVAASGDGLTPATAFKTIQEGINTAATGTSHGTVILVTQGTYTANLWLPDTQIKAFVLEGGWDSGFTSRNTDPSLTVINGNASGSVVALNYSMSEKTRVDISGFTLTNGSGQYLSGYGPYYEGGGIYANITAGLLELNLTGNAIVNNSVPDGALYSPSQGAGIFVNSVGGPVNISQNTINNNRFSPASTTAQAGGLKVTGSAWVDVQGNTVANNDREGAYYSALWNHSANNTYSANETGVSAYGSLVSSGDTITGNLLTGVHVSGNSGNVNIDHAAITNSGVDGIYLYSSYSQNGLTVVDSTITDNTGHGINIYNYSSEVKAKIERTRLNLNGGSGFYMDLYNSERGPVADLSIVNSVAAKNGASGVDLATGFSGTPSFVKIVNSTLTGNAVKGVNVSGNSNPPFDISVLNSILWGNYERDLYTTVGNVSASHSDIGTRTTTVDSIYNDQGGNISADPLLAGDYQLTSGSPAIDTGAASGLGILAPVLDLNSQTRPQGAGYDMGAFEYVAAPDTTPPTAVSTTPLNGTMNVPTNTLIAATFSENMLVSSITSTTFLVTGAAGTVPGSIIASGSTATFIPLSSLASGATYTATITTGAKDLAGNAMAANSTWSFTTLITAHTITASAGPYGTITPSGSIVVSDGGSQTFAVAPNAGYSISDVLVDLVSQGTVTTYTFTNVTADHTISASFADITPPVGTITINGVASYTNTLGVTLGLSCSDFGSGCSHVELSNFSNYSISTVWSMATGTTVSWTLTAGDGPKNVYARYTDGDGNTSLSVIGSIMLDTTPPATTVSPPGGTYPANQNVTLTCTDALTLCSIVYSTGTGTVLSTANTVSLLVTGGTTTLTYRAVDAAGNAEAVRTAVYTIDTSQPLVTLLTPTTNGFFNTAAVNYTLNKDMAVGQIFFVRTSGPADPSSHVYTMTGTDLLAGVHTVNTGFGNLVDGTVYTITVDVTDSAARNTTASSTNVTFDSTAMVAAITSPLSGGRVNTATVTYTLSEQAMAGDIVINDGDTQRVYSLTGSQLTSGSHTVDTGFTNSLVDGTVYTFSLANVVDLAGTPSTTVAVPNVIFDRTAVVITNTTPVSMSIITTVQAGYTLSEQAASGTVTFTRSGGNPDPASPHVYTMTVSDLTISAPHSVTPSFALVDGTFYIVSFAATDVAGNPATTVSNALVFFDSTYDPALPGNVDNTGSSSNLVNNADVLKLEQALEPLGTTRPGDRNWNPVCDLDRNGVVNRRDLTILQSHYGQTGP